MYMYVDTNYGVRSFHDIKPVYYQVSLNDVNICCFINSLNLLAYAINGLQVPNPVFIIFATPVFAICPI